MSGEGQSNGAGHAPARHPSGAVVEVPVLRTERLLLRGLAQRDFEAYAEMMADPDVTRHLADGRPLARADAWRQLAMFVGHWALRGFGVWAVEERATGRFLGRIGCFEPEGWPAFEIAYTLARHAWGRGYAREGAAAALRWARETLGRDPIVSVIRPDNVRSIAVATALGAVPDGSVEFFGAPALLYRYPPAHGAAPAFGFRPLAAGDLPLLHEWLARPHVAQWWGPPESLAAVEAHYGRILDGTGPHRAYLALVDGAPVGFIQSYTPAAGHDGGWWPDEHDPGVRGIDQFLADADRLGRGLGTAMVRAFTDRLLATPGVTRVQADPDPTNRRAVRCYEKAGFRAVGEVDTPDGRALLMYRDPPGC